MKVELLESCISNILQIDGVEIQKIDDKLLKTHILNIFKDILKENSSRYILQNLLEVYGELGEVTECDTCGSSYDHFYIINEKDNENK